MTGGKSSVLQVHAHEAVLELAADDGAAAPGAAVTVGLCGHWRHDGPCRWPHATSVASRSGRTLTVRVLYAAPPPERDEVRLRIAAALNGGELTGPGGQVHRWSVVREGPSRPLEGEEPLVLELSRRRPGT
jgi:hypothetical protein